MKKVAIIQSSYIPWRGYFDIIHDVDTFIFYDCVQFRKRDWRTRNMIKTPEGIQTLTIPVKGSIHNTIQEVSIDAESHWQNEHYKTFTINYGKAPYFKEYSNILNALYKDKTWNNLSEFNQYATKYIADILGIKTEFIDSTSLHLTGTKTDRLIDALVKVNAEAYISGPTAKDYIEEEKFTQRGIKLVYKEYPTYPQYPQLWGDFNGNLSIIDLLLNVGPDAPKYIWDTNTIT